MDGFAARAGLDATPEEALRSLPNAQSIEMTARLPPTGTVSDPGIGGSGVRSAARDHRRATTAAGSGHPTSALSLAHLIAN